MLVSERTDRSLIHGMTGNVILRLRAAIPSPQLLQTLHPFILVTITLLQKEKSDST
jgi:hypothetical protein